VAPHTKVPRCAKTAIYPPPRPGFPYVAVIFSRDGGVQARHPCASKEDVEAFLQAFTRGMRAAVPVSEQPARALWRAQRPMDDPDAHIARLL
jgi:hypothetical protein